MKKTSFLVVLLAIFVAPNIALARIGVGVATGKIILEEGLNPGVSYKLPNFVVINTGDQVFDYGVSIEYLQGKPELDPAKEWFSINPATFTLEPGATQNVNVNLAIPIKTTPGDYFTFIEAHPIKGEETPGASINVAAASKLYFTVKPANIFQGIYYKTIDFMKDNSPWTYIVLAVIVLAALVTFFRQKFSFNLSVGKKK